MKKLFALLLALAVVGSIALADPASLTGCSVSSGVVNAVNYIDITAPFSGTLQPFTWAEGKRGIEFTFATPRPFDHPVTGEPLIYTGRSDMIGEMGGGLYIEDDKTTSALGSSWTQQWDMRSQFTGYSWAARQSGLKISGIIIRGISILKTKYDHAQALTYRQDWMIDRWLQQTLRDLTRLEEMWKSGVFDYNLDESCNGYSGCLFRRVCLSEQPDVWLEADYERRVWDPLAHEEVSFEDWLAKQQ